MRGMFGFRKKPKTIYEKILSGKEPSPDHKDGQMELDHIEGIKPVEPVNTDALDIAILEYFSREPFSLEHLGNFFEKNKALSAIPSFENWLYEFDRMDRPMLGLSILLMRDSNVLEAVKFGIYLTQFVDLEGSPMAKEIVVNLGKHSEFSYYALDALLKGEKGTSSFYELGQELQGNGKKIYEKMARDLLEKRK